MPITIVALGDSTTAGTPGFRSPIEAPPSGEGDVRSQYAYWLEIRRPDWRVLNRGVNGERSDQILERFERDVIPPNPALAIVIAGVNDIYQGRAVEEVQRHLRSLYGRARAAAIKIVAGSILPFNTATADHNARMRRINEWIRQVSSADRHRAFCDTRRAVADPQNPDRLFGSPDELHPAPEGYRLMAEALLPVIEGLLEGDRRH